MNLSLLNGEANAGGDAAEVDEEDDLGLEAGVDNIRRKNLAKLISLDRGVGLAQFKRFTQLKTLGRSGGAAYEAACQVEGDTQEGEAQPACPGDTQEREAQPACQGDTQEGEANPACQGDTQEGEANPTCQGDPLDDYPPYKKPGSTYLRKNNGKTSSKGTEKCDGSPKVKRKFGALLEMIGKKKGTINYDDHKKGEAGSCQSGRKECLYKCENRGGSLKEARGGPARKERREAQDGAGAKRAERADLEHGEECKRCKKCEECKKCQTCEGCQTCGEWEEVKGLAASEAERVHHSHRAFRGERNIAPCLENIKQLLHLCDEQMKDLVHISNFEIDLDINSFYYNFVKENSESSISTYNINHSKNIFDVKQFKKYLNEKITTYKQTYSLNWGTYVCNISVQESCYFYYDRFGESTSSIYSSAASRDGAFLRGGKSNRENTPLGRSHHTRFNATQSSNVCHEKTNIYGCTELNGELRDNHVMEKLHRLYYPSGGCPNKEGLKDTPVDNAKLESKWTWEGPTANMEEHPLVSNHTDVHQNGKVALCRRETEKANIIDDVNRDLILHKIADGEEKEEQNTKPMELHFANKSKSNSKVENGLNVEDPASKGSAKGVSGGVDVDRSKIGAFSTMNGAFADDHTPPMLFEETKTGPPSDVAIFLSDQSCDYQNGYEFEDNNLRGGGCMLEPGRLHEVTDESVISGENENMGHRGRGEASQEEELRNASTMSSSDMWNPDRVIATGSQHWEGSFKGNGVGSDDQGNASMGRRKSIPRQLLVKLKKMCAGRATVGVLNRGVENAERSDNYSGQSNRTKERKEGVAIGGTSLWENCTRRNVHSQGNSRREEKDEKIESAHLDHARGDLNAHIQKEIKKGNHLLTNEYIDSTFDEIYYIQRINADNDSMFFFARIYQIYIFSKKWNSNDSGGKGCAKCTNKGGTLSDESAPCRTNVSVYVLIVLKNSLLKYIIKKKILNEISSRVDKWKKHIIIKAEHIKDGSVPLCIRMIERNDDVIDYIVKNVTYFFDNYLRDFFHLLVAHVNDFFGLGENRTLENYFERSSKKLYHFVQKKKVHLRNMYNDIVRKNEEKKKKTRQSIQPNQKKDPKKDQKKYTFCTYLFKRKKEHKTGDSPRKDEYSLRSSIFEPAFYYITSNEVAHNYIIYMNHIYFRRLLLLYLFVFVVYLVVSSCTVIAL
ncbi:hypothetical protein PCYB_082850 [Plasmodium cynomolgi strain B]|uniref:Uncharacterized protein n=1 Tax=Plasmodium cynomolgi (strain B) TaxID=1120755 RepID=K6USF1_PLACD|nr:hypothetical protein PCYB_082850 [Plasmodium cynomolgi strain B]GAB66124.1 hypothetical protein PCYB_082850 [Plasmodium cynomolgi strain B]